LCTSHWHFHPDVDGRHLPHSNRKSASPYLRLHAITNKLQCSAGMVFAFFGEFVCMAGTSCRVVFQTMLPQASQFGALGEVWWFQAFLVGAQKMGSHICSIARSWIEFLDLVSLANDHCYM
jgi:hypothetical protein